MVVLFIKKCFLKNHLRLVIFLLVASHLLSLHATTVVTELMIQQRVVSGTVSDAKGETMPGVNVLVRGTTTGVVTDTNGAYSINVPNAEAVLVFSFIGFVSQEVVVGDKTIIDLTLLEDVMLIEEVVVVGYGVQKKATITGAISSVTTEALIQSPVANISNSLTGRVTGLLSLQREGEPGNDQSILRIRGIGTFTGDRNTAGDPLVLVDGIESLSYNNIDPYEIESITVLKDASATAVYGIRGANGVLIIATKRGKMSKPMFSVSSNFGLQAFTDMRKGLRSYEYAKAFNEAIKLDTYLSGSPYVPKFTDEDIEHFRLGDDPIFHPDTDWMTLLLKPVSMQTRHNINIQGGTDLVRYFVSAGYFSQEGLFNNNDKVVAAGGYSPQINLNRFSFRSNFDFTVTKRLTASINLSSQIDNRTQPGDVNNANRIRNVINRIQITPPYTAPGIVDGKNVNTIDTFAGNPLDWLMNSGYSKTYVNDLTTTVSLKYKLDFITQGLNFQGRVSNLNEMYNRKRYTKSIQIYRPVLLDNGETFFAPQKTESPFGYSESTGKNRKTYLEAGLYYDRTFSAHGFGGLFLYQQDKLYAPGLLYAIPNGHQGLIGRITYNYKMRYLAEFNMAYNGTENFAVGKRFGFFPAYSLGWIVSEEPFYPANNIVSYVKIRGAYGEVGNDRIGGQRFMYLPSVYLYSSGADWNTPNRGGYFFGIPGVDLQNHPSAYEGALGNPDLTWERAKKSNIGVDLVLFKNKIKITADYFYEIRSNILTNPGTTPQIVGTTLPASNWGEMENKGYDGDISYTDRIGKFDFWIKGNYTFARNKILFMDEVPRLYPHMYRTGLSRDQPFGFIAEGFYNTWEEVNDANRAASNAQNNRIMPGDVKYRDINGDGITNDQDQVPIGYPQFPEIIYGISFGGGYKEFDFSVLFQGAAHTSRFMNATHIRPFENELYCLDYIPKYSWTPEKYENGETIKLPRLTCRQQNSHNYSGSTLMLQDASYLRLKNAEIGYSFNSAFLKRFKINSCRIYVNGNNLLTWSGLFPGEDPEQESFSGDTGYYPLTKTYNFGINIQF